MTGIARLRELADKYAELGKDHATIDVVPSGMAMLFSSIANQIEREHACDGDTAENIRLIVGGVIDDMERHVLGHEGMEDSPVARWARELREALGGDERDHADEREAIAWVREHGGLDMVRRMFRDADSRRVELCGALSIDLDTGWSDAMAELDRRLMPEGCEWPRYESGEPVRIGDAIVDGLGHAHEVSSVEVFDDAEALHWSPSEPEDFVWLVHGERVKHPAPKVLDADGVEILVGDEVWDVDGSGPFVVSGFVGEPLAVIFEIAECNDLPRKPSQLTHQRPDSWERLEGDADALAEAEINGEGSYNAANAYCNRRGLGEGTSFVLMARDLVRRAKALAGDA